MAKYPRGMTNYGNHDPETRPPNLKDRVYNEFRPDTARGSTMPAPTSDTEEPRLSRRLGKSRR